MAIFFIHFSSFEKAEAVADCGLEYCFLVPSSIEQKQKIKYYGIMLNRRKNTQEEKISHQRRSSLIDYFDKLKLIIVILGIVCGNAESRSFRKRVCMCMWGVIT